MIKVNGKNVENIVGKKLSDYIVECGHDIKRIAVERNGEIVFKSQYAETVLQDGDDLEIVSFVGGG